MQSFSEVNREPDENDFLCKTEKRKRSAQLFPPKMKEPEAELPHDQDTISVIMGQF